MVGIYKITNSINGKVYIGMSKDVQGRWRGHKLDLRRGKHCNSYLQNARNKYGEDAFQFSVLEECTKEELPERKIYYIQLYNSTNPDIGYNLCKGGEGFTGVVAEKTKAKISSSLKGRKKPEGFGERLSKITKGNVPEETRAKIRKAAAEWWVTATEEQKALRKKHLSESGKGRKPTDEQLKARAASWKKWWYSLSEEEKKEINKKRARKRTEEERKRLSIAIKEARRNQPPRIISEETRRKLSAAARKKRKTQKTPEQLKRMSEAQKRYLTEHPEAIENLRQKAREQAARGISEETRNKCRLASFKGAAKRKGMTLEEYFAWRELSRK